MGYFYRVEISTIYFWDITFEILWKLLNLSMRSFQYLWELCDHWKEYFSLEVVLTVDSSYYQRKQQKTAKL